MLRRALVVVAGVAIFAVYEGVTTHDLGLAIVVFVFMVPLVLALALIRGQLDGVDDDVDSGS